MALLIRRQRLVAFSILVGLWTAGFAALLLWEKSNTGELATLARPRATELASRFETEERFEAMFWLLGVTGMAAAFIWFQRLDSAREQTLAVLRKNEHDLASILGSIEDMVFAIDADGRIRSVLGSTSQATLFGQARNCAGEHYRDACPANAAEALQEALTRLAADGQVQEIDFVLDTNGTPGFWRGSVSRRRSASGATEGAIVVVRDVTRRGKAEMALRDNEERWRLIYERTGEGIVLSCLDGTYVSANPAACEILGMSEAELIQTGRGLVAEPSRATFQQLVEHRDRNGVARGELQLRRADGTLVDLEGSTSLFHLSSGETRVVTIMHDITARRRAEQVARENALRWQAALDAVGDGLWDCNLQTDEAFFSPTALKILGYEPDEIPGRMAEWRNRIHPEDFTATIEGLRRYLAGKTDIFEAEHRVRCKDGTYKWLLIRGRVVARAPGGQPARMIGTNKDLTTAREAEHNLRESEERYRHLLDSATGYVFTVLLQDGRVAKVKRTVGCFAVTGYTVEENYANPQLWLETVAPANRAAVEAHWAEALRGEPGKPIEYQILHKDGSVRWVRGTLVARRDPRGALAGFDGLVQDVTERKVVELALRESEEKFHQAFHHAPLIMVVTDLADGRILEANDLARRISGIEPAEGLGRSAVDLGWFTAEDRARLIELLKTQQRVTDLELIGCKKNGERINCLVNCQLVTVGGNTRVITTLQDITARKTAERALRESEERYRTLVELSPEAVFVHDHGRVLFANRAGLRLAGAESPEQVVGGNVLEFVHRDSRADVEKRMRETEAIGQRAPALRQKWHRLNGELIEVSVVATRVMFEGKPATLAIAMDITAQLQAEVELRKLSRAVEQSPVTVVITNVGGGIEYVNPSFTAKTGYTFEEVRGKTSRILRSGETPPEKYRELWQTILAGREWRGEFHNRKKNGELFWEAATISPIFDEAGKITHFLAVKEDITEQKLAADRIREQAALLDVTEDGIVVLNLKREVTYMNRAAEEMYGWSAAQALGRTYESIAYRESPADLEVSWKEFMASGTRSAERRQVSRKGEEIVVRIRGTLVRDDKGRPRAALIVVTDITEAKRTEANFLRAQRLESLGSLAGGVAHDLNNVLTPILIATDLLRLAVTQTRDREVVQLINDSARRGAEIVQQLLLFGRGNDTPRTMVDVGAVVRGMDRMMRETFPKSLSLRVQAPKELWPVEADRTQIHQVLLNLCVNARDAMPQGGSLMVTAENVHVDEAFAERHVGGKPGSFVAIRVSDTGSGIPAEHLEKIFDPFFTTKPIGQGTGLGLATVLGIARSHGGFVSVATQVGSGTTFTFFLPAKQSAAMTEASAEQRRVNIGRSELVLLVDDEAMVRTALGHSLEDANYRVITAANGAEALAVFAHQAQSVRLVITDMMMPIMDGMQLVHALRRLAPSMPILAMSGLPQTCEELQRSHGKHLRFLSKPFLTEAVLRNVRELVDEAAPPP